MLLIAVVTSFGFKPNGYTVTGNIVASDGTRFYLYYQYNGREVKDSAAVIANQFVIKGNLPEPIICTLSNSANQQIRVFLAENANISITGKVQSLIGAEIKGCSENLLYNEFNQKSLQLSVQYRSMLKASGANLHDKKSEPSRLYHLKQDSLVVAFVKNHSGTTAASLAIFDSYVTNPDRSNAQLYYALLSPKGKQSIYAKRVLQFINSVTNISPGHPAPDFELKDTQGKPQKLSDYKGKYVLLDFWASWCAPCRAEHPNLIKCYQTYANDNFKFIGISMDSGQSQWRQAIGTDGLPWIQLNDPRSMNGDLAESYGVKAIPFNCIVNPQGIIEAVNLRGEVLTRYLAAHFKANE